MGSYTHELFDTVLICTYAQIMSHATGPRLTECERAPRTAAVHTKTPSRLQLLASLLSDFVEDLDKL